MKHSFLLVLATSLTTLLAEDPSAQNGEQPPVFSIGTAPAVSNETFVYEQKPAGGRPVLIAPEQAKSLIERFKAAYPELGSPRVVLYVNRDLVDEESGLRLTGRKERTQNNSTEVKTEFKADPNAPAPSKENGVPNASNVTIVGNVNGNRNNVPGAGAVNTRTERTTGENTYSASNKKQGTLADKQTVRDVERLFGRPLRMAGVALADQRVASQLLSTKPASLLEGEQAVKDREALSKIADVALEVLISSRDITVTEISGDKIYTVPDIQATAIRLSDAKILGQTTASDIIGKDRYAGNIARNFDVREIAEATALALMEDMLLGVSE